MELLKNLIYLDMIEETKPCIIIIGAGLSGLTAARQILKKQPSFTVTVLEANDYVGGRTKSIMLNDCCFDLGGSFIGPSQQHAIQLALQSKNQLVPVNDQGRKVIDIKQGYYTYTGDIPSIGNIFALIQMQFSLMKLNRMARKVSTTSPKDCPLGYKWDSMTVQSWLEQNLSSIKTKVMVQGVLRVILGVELSEISLLYFLYYIRQSRDFQNLITVANGLQEKKTSKGTQHMSLFLGEQIKEKGGKIKLNFFVNSVEQNSERVVVTSSKGQKIVGTYLIMAMPPSSVTKIHFSPPLSVQRRMICERSFMGALAKVLVLYPQAYWKQKGFSGEVISDCFNGPAMNVFDDTRVNSEGKEQPGLIVFVGGGAYRYWREQKDFQEMLKKKLASFFKEPKMIHPISIKWLAWQDQASIGGSPVCNFPPGVLSQVDDLRRPEGRIHWAGTEMATVSTGFMDGAIESGKRVAKEVLKRLTEGEKSQNPMETFLTQMPPPYTKYNKAPPLSFMNRLFEWW